MPMLSHPFRHEKVISAKPSRIRCLGTRRRGRRACVACVLNENGQAPLQARKYLDSVGGDVYLKSRPGETAEYTVYYLPLQRSAQGSRLKLKNQIGTRDMARAY